MTEAEIEALEDHLTIELKTPITVGTMHWKEFTVHEPTAGQLREITAQSGIDSTITAIVLTAGVPAGVAEKIPARPLVRAQEFFDRFLERPTKPAA